MRYRKLTSSMYADAKFCSLTNAEQHLWIFLFTGPHITSLPGIFRSGPAALAESHRISVEDLTAGVEKFRALGMVDVSWEDRVVVIKNMIDHNPPASPNVVKSWTDHLAEVPDCKLKREYIQHVAKFLERKGRSFSEAFVIPSRKDLQILPERISNPSPNQKQLAVAVSSSSKQDQITPKPTVSTQSVSLKAKKDTPWTKGLSWSNGAKITTPEEDDVISHLQGFWADVWGKKKPKKPPTGSDLCRLLEALWGGEPGGMQDRHALEIKSAIKGQCYRAKGSDIEANWSKFSSVFPPAITDDNGKDMTRLNWSSFNSYVEDADSWKPAIKYQPGQGPVQR